jgi:hypothetical protein
MYPNWGERGWHRKGRTALSRLNYAADHELAIDTIVEELGVLERFLASGQRLSEEDAIQLLDCLGRLRRLVEVRDWHSDNEALPDWLTPLQEQADQVVDKQQATGVRKSAAS